MTYTTYLPVVNKSPNYLKGLAASDANNRANDIRLLGATWSYAWGHPTPAGVLPMSRNGDDPNLPLNYSDFCLLFNEPDANEPAGHPFTPLEALFVYNTLQQKYPLCTWIIGNVKGDDIGSKWLIEFNSMSGPIKGFYGMHGYSYDDTSLTRLKDTIELTHNALKTDFWITEWASPNGNLQNTQAMYEWMKSRSWIQRAAYFTNRNYSELSNWKTGLVDSNGNLTSIGQWFKGVS